MQGIQFDKSREPVIFYILIVSFLVANPVKVEFQIDN